VTGPVRISVVIPTYQRRASIQRALEALGRQTLPATEFEVIVPIDGSDDGTREMLDGFQAPFRLTAIWQPNQGRAAARNAGTRLANGELIVFLDDDMEPTPGLLQAHLDAHPAGSRRAIVGPVPIPADSSSGPIVSYRRDATNALLARLAQPGYRLGFRDVYTGNLSLQREVLRQVGGLDETFKLYGHEDYELAFRLAKAGVEFGYSPDAVAYQQYDKNFAGLARDCVDRGHTAVLFARKHPEIASGLKLNAYDEGSYKWRLARSVLLWLTGLFPRLPERMVAAMARLERRQPPRLHHYYTLALDYFFWVGATSALRENGARGVRRTALAALALACLVLFALASSLRLLGRAVQALHHLPSRDAITSYEDRFRELRPALPPVGRVGYVTDPEIKPAEGLDAPRLAFKRYLLTQYALLPTIVLPDTQAGLVVGNFEAAEIPNTDATAGLRLVRDYGNGVMLFRSQAQ
jgi:GT2 family glycosyltransferase